MAAVEAPALQRPTVETPRLVLFLALMFLNQAVLALAFNTPAILAPVAAPTLGVRAETIGPYFALMSLAGGLSGLFLTALIRRHGGVRSLQVGLGFALAGLLCGASAQPWLVVLSCFVLGLSGGLLPVASVHLLARMAPPRRAGLIFAINQCGVPVGAAAGGILIPTLLQYMHWRSTLLVVALLVVAIALALQSVRALGDGDRGRSIAHRPHLLAPLGMVLAHPALRALVVVCIVYMAMQTAGMAYLVTYVNLELGKTLLVAGSALAAAQLTSVAVRLTLGWMLDRSGKHFTVLAYLGLGSGVMGIAMASLGSGLPDWAVVLITGVFGGFAFGWTAIYFAAVARLAPEGQRAAAVSGMHAYQMAGALAGPFAFSVISALTGSMDGGFALIALLAFATGAWLLFARPARGNH